jgi:hypothetical protein
MTKLIKVKNDDLTEVTQPVPTAVEFEEIASGSVELPVGTNKSIFLDSLDGEYKNIDSLGVVSPFGSGGGGGLQPVFIDHTSIPAELVRNRIYEADFSGAPVDSTLVVTFPEGTGSETFILGFRITGLSQGSTVTFVTTNTQDIFFPDATTDTTITGVNAKTYFEFAWDQTRFVYGDVDSPTFADLSASLGDVEVDTLTVGTSIIGGEATVSQAGTVKKNKYARVVLAAGETGNVPNIAIDGDPLNSHMYFDNLVIGQDYEIKLSAVFRITGISDTEVTAFRAIHNGSRLLQVNLRSDGNLDFRGGVLGNSKKFTATATSISFEFADFGTGNLLPDDNMTFAELEKLENTELTTDFI